jgi:hypothetical protein
VPGEPPQVKNPEIDHQQDYAILLSGFLRTSIATTHPALTKMTLPAVMFTASFLNLPLGPVVGTELSLTLQGRNARVCFGNVLPFEVGFLAIAVSQA